MPLTQLKATMTKPRNALMASFAAYGVLAYYMSTKYYQNSSMKKVFVNASEEYEQIKVMHAPGKY